MVEPYYERDGIVIYNCDCRQAGEFLEAGSIDSVVTDPPYGLAFMGKEWDHGVPGIPFWSEILKVAKPGAMMLAFGGTRTFHRLACAIEDSGWEIRDCIQWLYGSGFPKSMDVSKAIDKAAGAEREIVGTVRRWGANASGGRGNQNANGYQASEIGAEKYDDITAPATDAAKLWDGWGTALKPAYEPITVAMKPLDGTFASNALKHGVAGLNIDGCRVPADDGVPRFTHRGESTKNTYGDGKNGSNRTGEMDTVTGRFPANVIHDGSDEVLAGFPQTKSQGHTPKTRGNGGLGCNGHSGQEKIVEKHHDSGSAARFFYCPKASSSERGSRPDKALPLFGESEPGFTNTHPTVKPLALMTYLLQLVSTPTGGLVLDPFMGSGSTLVAAKALGRKAIGIEINKEYCDIAIARLGGT